MVETHPDPGVRASAILGRLFLADKAGDTAAIETLFRQIQATYDAINGKNATEPRVAFVSVSFDGSRDTVTAFRKTWPMPWHHAYASFDAMDSIAEDWKLPGLPQAILVGADGTIVATEKLRGDDLLPTLQTHVSNTGSPSSAAPRARR